MEIFDAVAVSSDAFAEMFDAYAKISYEKIQAAKVRAESTDELKKELKDDLKTAADNRAEAVDSRRQAADCRAEAARRMR